MQSGNLELTSQQGRLELEEGATVHETLGKLILSPTALNSLEHVTPDRYQSLPKGKEYVYNDFIYEVRGAKLILKSTARRIGLVQAKDYGDIPRVPEGQKIQLPPPKQLLHVYAKIILDAHLEKRVTVPNREVAYWISIFCFHGGSFLDYYADYINDPDESVVVVEGATAQYIEAYRELPSIPAIKRTGSDVRATIHLLLITMKKSFGDSAEQLPEFMKRRMSTIYNSLGVPVGTLCLPDDFFKGQAEIFQLLPKLQRMLFHFAYRYKDESKELGTSLTLLDHAAMGMISQIISFLDAPEKTLAHRNYQILEEAGRFIKAVHKEKQETGCMWPYWRILNPDSTALQNNLFPNLAVASHEYAMRFSDTFKNFKLKVSGAMPGWKKLVNTEDDPTLYTTTERKITDSMREAAHHMGLDIERLKTLESRPKQPIIPPEITQFLAQFNR
ncbi:nucleoprotein [Hymenopteran anphe-related virus OKIAV71]|uniref:Nucleoprotein n=1 Tax=Hymenopteran anphe-related virus OKIAV71 TaxID=2792596 RepID=A0AAE7P8J4_9MONO|nr:nucleoprotein [Hymenopteran anphe-related virus OKIAV71]QPL15376.1 nucleoprotein [Hymenopteran anphe-related virus OKIAV71]